MKSIMQDRKECYLCRMICGEHMELSDKGLHKHHVIFGTANRKVADKNGCWCYLCPPHHEFGDTAVHNNHATDMYLKRKCQMAFERKGTMEEWMSLFGKSYL